MFNFNSIIRRTKICTLLLTFLFLSLSNSSVINAQGFSWLNNVSGGNTNEFILTKSIVSDSLGYSYITGTFFDGAVIDTCVLNSQGEEDIFIAKLDPNGNLIWVNTVGGQGKDISYDIEIDKQGGLYFCGVYTDTAFFDTISVTGSTQNQLGINFLAKYDTSGAIQWIKKGAQTFVYEFKSYDEGKINYKDGYLYYAASNFLYPGNTVSQQSFDSFLLPGITIGLPTNGTVQNSFILKTNPSGVNSWIRPIAANPSNTASSGVLVADMDIKTNGHVVMQCFYSNNIVVDTASFTGSPPLSIYKTNSCVIIELDSSSFFYNSSPVLPSVGIYGFGSNGSFGLGVDASNDVIYILNSISSYNIAGTPIASGTIFLVKLDSSLNPILANEITSNNNETIFNAFEVKDDQVLFGGTLSGNLNIGSATYFRSRECVFISIDTSLVSINWFASTTSDYSFSLGSFLFNYNVFGCDIGDDGATYFTGKTGLVPMGFGDYSSNANSINNGFATKIIACEPTLSMITPVNPVICGTGSSITLNANYNSDLNLKWFYEGLVQNGSIGNTFVTANTGSYFIEIDSMGCKDTSNTVDVVFSSLPNVSTPANTITICSDGGIVPLVGGLPSGGIWSGFGVLNDTLFDPSVVAAGPTLLTYTYTNLLGCSASDVQIANVVPPPSLLLSNTLPSFCEADPAYSLNSIVFPGGGTYSGPGVNNNTFNPDSAGVGTHLVSYNYGDATGCFATTTFLLTVSAAPLLNFPAINPVCETTFAIPLNTAQPTGGTYEGPFVISNNFYPFLSGAGSFPVAYSLTQNGCTVSDTQRVTVESISQAVLNNPGDYCVNAAIDTLSVGVPIGGGYQINGTNSTIVDPAILGIGTYTLKYQYTNSCGTSIDSQTFEINALPVTSISGFGPLCENSTNVVLNTGTPSGGVYSGSGVSVNTFIPSVVGPGMVYTFYSYTDNNGCSAIDSVLTTINTSPVATATIDSLYCVNQGPYNLSANPVGGSWNGSGVSGNIFSPNTAGIGFQNLQYVVINSFGCIDTFTQNVEVKNLPNVNLFPLSPICNSNSNAVPLSGGSPAGGMYSGVGVTNGFFNPGLTGSGFFTVSYSYTDVFGCTASANQNLTVDTNNTNLTQSDFQSICISVDSISLSGGSPLGGFYSGVTVINDMFYPADAGTGNFDITYSFTGQNSCIATIIKSITVDSLPIVSLPPFSDVCLSDSVVALTGGQPAGGIYTGTGISAGFFTPELSNVGNVFVEYSYTDANGCSETAYNNLMVLNLPVVSLNSVAVCEGTAPVNLNTGLPLGGVYNGPGILAGLFNPAASGVGTHLMTYSYTDSNGCSAFDTSFTLVNALPVLNLSLPDQTCINASPFVLSSGFPFGGVYNGSAVSGISFDPYIAGLGTSLITYTYVDSNNCVNSIFDSVFVNALPLLSITADSSVCEGDTANILASGAISFLWNTADTSAAISVSPSASSFYFVSAIDSNGCSAEDSVLVRVDTLSLSINTIDANCNGDLGLAYANVAGNGLNYFYNWSNGITSDSISAFAGFYCLTVTDNNGCIKINCSNIIEPNLLFASVSDNGNGIATATAVGGTVQTAYNYLWSDGQMTAVASGLQPGISCVTITDDNACVDTACISLLLTDDNLSDLEFNDISIYPNPTSKILFIDLKNLMDKDGLTLTVYDLLGRILERRTIEEEVEKIDLEQVSSGVYLIYIRGEQREFIQRVIKE